MEEKIKPATVRLPVALLRRIRMEAVRRGENLQTLIAALLTQALAKKGTE